MYIYIYIYIYIRQYIYIYIQEKNRRKSAIIMPNAIVSEKEIALALASFGLFRGSCCIQSIWGMRLAFQKLQHWSKKKMYRFFLEQWGFTVWFFNGDLVGFNGISMEKMVHFYGKIPARVAHRSYWILMQSQQSHMPEIPYLIELDDGKIYRKALYLMVKTMVSCKFSLKPIHWISNRCSILMKYLSTLSNGLIVSSLYSYIMTYPTISVFKMATKSPI